jgi:carboxylesterase type B
MLKVKVLIVLLLMSLIIPVIIANNKLPRAHTKQGIYIGRQTTINGTNVNYWYGIPYAQQPIGNLRWMPPQVLPTSNGTIVAYTPNACPQAFNFGVLLTEACLTLNVYAPENAINLPVYVWIHGGSFIAGAGIAFNATPFVSTSINYSVPIVIVTINYRLGFLGFLADQEFYDEKSGINNRSTTGNYGMLDQMMALDWIKKNIAGFGGNPEQITIGGESAGGVSISILLTSPLITNGTFQRAIIESGDIWPNFATPLQNAINSTGSILRAAVNCTTTQCLRNLTVDQIITVQNTVASKSLFEVAASPVIDGYVLNDIMENSYARGDFQKIPLLVGTTTNETSTFTCPLFNGSATIEQVQTFFDSIYNATMISQISDIYGPISTYSNPLTYLNLVYSDSWAHCGSRRIAAKFSTYGVPSYLYTYNHLIPVAPSCFGVSHATELIMLFPSFLPDFYPNYNFTALEQQLSTNMMLYWANFIHTSNPNFEGSPANWDAYAITSDNDFVLDIYPRMRNYYYNASCSRLWDPYAVTNSTFTSFTTTYINKYQYF